MQVMPVTEPSQGLPLKERWRHPKRSNRQSISIPARWDLAPSQTVETSVVLLDNFHIRNPVHSVSTMTYQTADILNDCLARTARVVPYSRGRNVKEKEERLRLRAPQVVYGDDTFMIVSNRESFSSQVRTVF